MTRRMVPVGIVLWAVFASLIVLDCARAHCAYCPRHPCYNTSSCGGECVCIQEQEWKPGRCVWISPYAVRP